MVRPVSPRRAKSKVSNDSSVVHSYMKYHVVSCQARKENAEFTNWQRYTKTLIQFATWSYLNDFIFIHKIKTLIIVRKYKHLKSAI